MIKRLITIITLSLAALALAPVAWAIPTGTYNLHNHPDGGAADPLYGLRLDELINVTGRHDIFTFDFNDSRSNMMMTYDGSSVVISGQAWGGLDIGSTYDVNWSALWDINFVYDIGVTSIANGGLNDVVVDANLQNMGTISSSLGSFDLIDYKGGHPYSFYLGDEGGSGHRGYDGISGWGWVNHSGANGHVAASDWLFTATEVPEPGSIALLGVGLIGLMFRRRFKTSI